MMECGKGLATTFRACENRGSGAAAGFRTRRRNLERRWRWLYVASIKARSSTTNLHMSRRDALPLRAVNSAIVRSGTNDEQSSQNTTPSRASHLRSFLRKRWLHGLLFVVFCISGLAFSHNHGSLRHFRQPPQHAVHHDHSIASCFQLASACYGNWSQEAAHESVNRSCVNIVWLAESEAGLLSPATSGGRALIQSVLLELQHSLSDKPSCHFFVGNNGLGFPSELARLQSLFQQAGLDRFEISSLPIATRGILMRMLTTDIVVAAVGSLADIVSQFSAAPIVIQVLQQPCNSVPDWEAQTENTTPNNSTNASYFVGSWIDSSVVAAGGLNSAVFKKLNTILVAPDRFETARKIPVNCNSQAIFSACEAHFTVPTRLNSCFWGVRSRFDEAHVQLAELVAFIKSSRSSSLQVLFCFVILSLFLFLSSLQFVYEPVFPRNNRDTLLQHSWVDDYLGISRLMSALGITTVQASGLPALQGHLCDDVVRLTYAESVLRLNRDPSRYAEHLCPARVFKGSGLAALPLRAPSAAMTHFTGHQLRGRTSVRTKPLTCQGFTTPRHSSDYKGWPQNAMSEEVTPPHSACSNQRGMRRCHDVYGNHEDGVAVRVCQWRLPDGPCEDLDRNHREQLIAVTKSHIFLDVFPVVRLAWRTRIFGASPPASQARVCTRADETIACATVDDSGVPGWWDKLKGAGSAVDIHGALWHLRDTPGLWV
jgi:hypothetical protein